MRLLHFLADLPARWRGGGRLPAPGPAAKASPEPLAVVPSAVAAQLVEAGRSQIERQLQKVGFGVPVQPHQCDPCGQVVTSITRDQAAAFERDGIIPCPCGGILRPVMDRPGTESAAPVFTHPADHTTAGGCVGEGCSAVQFVCPRCGVLGFGDHCAEDDATGAPVALCFGCDDWVTGRFADATSAGAR